MRMHVIIQNLFDAFNEGIKESVLELILCTVDGIFSAHFMNTTNHGLSPKPSSPINGILYCYPFMNITHDGLSREPAGGVLYEV